MGTTADKLLYLSETKEQIRQAIIDKGVDVSTSDPFRDYPDKIEQISGGGGGGDEWIDLRSKFINLNPSDDIFKDLDSLIHEIENIEEVQDE